MRRSCEDDPSFDYLLILFLETTVEPLTVLPTHRVVRGLGQDGLAALEAGLPTLFNAEPADRATLESEFGGGVAPGGKGRFGLWTRAGGWVLTARRYAFARSECPGGPARRGRGGAHLGPTPQRAPCET